MFVQNFVKLVQRFASYRVNSFWRRWKQYCRRFRGRYRA